MNLAAGFGVEIPTCHDGQLGFLAALDDPKDVRNLLQAVALFPGCVQMGIQRREVSPWGARHDDQCGAWLVRPARAGLDRLHRKGLGEIRHDAGTREGGDAVLSAVVIQRTSERRGQTTRVRDHPDLVHAP